MSNIGHNHLADISSRVVSLCDELMGFTSISADNSAKAKDAVDKAKKLEKEIEEARKITKDPHLKAAADVDAAFNPFKDKIKAAWTILNKQVEAWMLAERARAEAVAREAARIAEEEARKNAPVEEFIGEKLEETVVASMAAKEAQKLVEKAAQLKGNDGNRASGLRVVRSASVKDGKALVLHFWEHPDVLGAATKLANAAVRAAKGGPVNIPGIAVIEEHKLV
jgi:hypothetical protein